MNKRLFCSIHAVTTDTHGIDAVMKNRTPAYITIERRGTIKRLVNMK